MTITIHDQFCRTVEQKETNALTQYSVHVRMAMGHSHMEECVRVGRDMQLHPKTIFTEATGFLYQITTSSYLV